MKIEYHKELYGKQVYPNWRIDKNISWFNVQSLIFGFIFANMTLMFLWNWKDYKVIINPFGTKYWLPPRYAENYHTIHYEVGEEPSDNSKTLANANPTEDLIR